MRLRGINEIVSNLIDNIRDKASSIDTKEGTFIRDVFIDPVAQQLSEVYQELKLLENAQSIETAVGDDLDKLAANYFVKRKEGTKSRGTLRFYVKTTEDGDKPSVDFSLPFGTVVNTQPDTLNQSLFFTTLSKFSYYATQNPTNLQFDNRLKLYYFEVDAQSVLDGTNNNIDSYKATQLSSGISSYIVGVTNITPFVGGSDGEDDASLITRIGLVLLGANIGTKNGYSSLLLSQPDVAEVRVVGAGDILMTRDLLRTAEGVLLTPNVHEGGKVDIYVNTPKYQDSIYEFTYNGELTKVLPNQPVKEISSLIQRGTNGQVEKVFVNESSCDFEKDLNGNIFYYQDVEWVFENTNGTTVEELNIKLINSSLLSYNNLKEISSVSVYVDINREDLVETDYSGDFLFYFGTYVGNVYKLQTKTIIDEGSPFVDIVDVNHPNYYLKYYTFVKKNGKIYHRKYVSSDYRLKIDNGDNYGSYKAQDRIEWITGKAPFVNKKIVANYKDVNHIPYLQTIVDENRTLTADVLVKRAKPVPTIINVQVVPYEEYTFSEIVELTISKIKNYMDTFQGMGEQLDLSNLTTLVRIVEGIKYVGLSKSSIMILKENNQWQTKRTIKLENNEYFDVRSIYVNAISEEEFLEEG